MVTVSKIINESQAESYTNILFSDSPTRDGIYKELSSYSKSHGLLPLACNDQYYNFHENREAWGVYFEMSRVLSLTGWEFNALRRAIFQINDVGIPVSVLGVYIALSHQKHGDGIKNWDVIALSYQMVAQVAGVPELNPYLKRMDSGVKLLALNQIDLSDQKGYNDLFEGDPGLCFDIEPEKAYKIMNSVNEQDRKAPWNSLYCCPFLWRGGISLRRKFGYPESKFVGVVERNVPVRKAPESPSRTTPSSSTYTNTPPLPPVPQASKTVNEPCPKCSGGGKLQCSTCWGRLYIPCNSCSGQGSIACYSCGGTRTEMGTDWTGNRVVKSCSRCNGSGTDSCLGCHGARQFPCSTCSTTGEIACTACRGAGVLTKTL